MFLFAVAVALFSAAAAAGQAQPHPRQATAAAAAAAVSSPSPSASGSLSSVVQTAIGTTNGSATGVVSLPPTVPVTLITTNPTAVPLTAILPNETSTVTVPLDTTVAAGATPTGIPGAPPLPDISRLNPANYPPLDKPPPVDSPEVQAWIAQFNASGFNIPNIPVNQPGGCSANPAAVADASRCWWTCSQCTRSTDIITCPDKMTWGSSFDDGPSPYTPNLIQYLDQQNLKTTFFVVGSRVISRPDYLRSQYMGGHQIAVHTWSHSPLTTQTTEEIIAEFAWSKKVISDVLGVTPIYMRPPYGDIDDRVRAIAAAMNLVPIVWTSGTASSHVSFDTDDFNLDAGTVSPSQVIKNFDNILGNASIIPTGFIVLEHDLFLQAVQLATGYTLPQALAQKFTLKPIVSCQNLPLSNAYIETNNNASNPLPTAVGSSVVVSPSASAAAAGSAGSSSSKSGAVGAAANGVWAAAQVVALGVLGAVAAL